MRLIESSQGWKLFYKTSSKNITDKMSFQQRTQKPKN